MGLKINNVEHFNAVMAFASLDMGRLTNLVTKLNYLLEYGEPHYHAVQDDGYTEVVLTPDFAAHSFLFTCTRVAPVYAEVITEERRHLMSGGFIYDPSCECWNVHT